MCSQTHQEKRTQINKIGNEEEKLQPMPLEYKKA